MSQKQNLNTKLIELDNNFQDKKQEIAKKVQKQFAQQKLDLETGIEDLKSKISQVQAEARSSDQNLRESAKHQPTTEKIKKIQNQIEKKQSELKKIIDKALQN